MLVCFFATDGSIAGDIGVVNYISRAEWKRFNGKDGSRPGRLHFVEPQGILRIANQLGFFLESPHPELYRQLVPHTLFFHQRDGEVFEDETLIPPVSYKQIYPNPDPVLSRLPKVTSSVSSVPLQWEPPFSISQVLDESAYMEVVRSSIDTMSDLQSALVSSICRLHVVVTAHPEKLDDYVATLHHLIQVSEYALRFGVDDLQEFLDFSYFQYLRKPDQRQHFATCVAEAVPAWKDAADQLASVLLR